MPTPVWTLSYRSTEQTLQAWGISSCTRTRVAFGTDTAHLWMVWDLRVRSPFDAEREIVITRDAVVWFRGRVTSSAREARGSQMGLAVTVSGAWWYLENKIFAQALTWAADSNVSGAIVDADNDGGVTSEDIARRTASTGMVILGRDAEATIQTADLTAREAIQYAIDAGAPLQIGTIDTGPRAFLEEAKDITCAEAVRRAMRWTPDRLSWCDYTTDPPTIHIRSRGNRSAHTLALDGGESQAVGLRPMTELQTPGVRINYLLLHQRETVTFRTVSTDEAGDPDNWSGLILSVEIDRSYQVNGGAVSYIQSVPTGLAAALYVALHHLEWAGQITIKQQDLGDSNWIARKLRITGGPPEWTKVTASIQSVSEEVISGATTLSLGPSPRLGIADLLSLLRASRGGNHAPSGKALWDAATGGSPTGAPPLPVGGTPDPRWGVSPTRDPDDPETEDGGGGGIYILRVNMYHIVNDVTGQGTLLTNQADRLIILSTGSGATLTTIYAHYILAGAQGLDYGIRWTRGADIYRGIFYQSAGGAPKLNRDITVVAVL